ncbi:MAG: class I SAM-dependent methyltransferase [bacterium]
MEQDIVKRFFTGTGASYDFVVNLFTYGADRYWKKKMLATVPTAKTILDLACGTGILTFKLLEKFPECEVVGVDRMPEYLAVARQKLRRRKLKKVHFICARAEQIQFKTLFDCITSSYIPKYVPAEKLVGNISANLQQGGSLVLHDFALPEKFVFQRLWAVHMKLMKYLGTPLLPKWRVIFCELEGLVRSTQWITEYQAALRGRGFQDIQVKRLTAGSAAILTAIKGWH